MSYVRPILPLLRISIPFGAIKSEKNYLSTIHFREFQFLLVRLKVYDFRL